MSDLHLCMGIKKNCWNLIDSMGEICVQCRCCSSDPKTRAEARLYIATEHLKEKLAFNDWDDDSQWRALQERNVKSDIKYFRRQVRYYAKRVNDVRCKR